LGKKIEGDLEGEGSEYHMLASEIVAAAIGDDLG
jgi:hypothetical protein